MVARRRPVSFCGLFFPPTKNRWLRPAPSASDELAHESKYHYLIRPMGACHTHFLDCNKCHFSAIEASGLGWGGGVHFPRCMRDDLTK